MYYNLSEAHFLPKNHSTYTAYSTDIWILAEIGLHYDVVHEMV